MTQTHRSTSTELNEQRFPDGYAVTDGQYGLAVGVKGLEYCRSVAKAWCHEHKDGMANIYVDTPLEDLESIIASRERDLKQTLGTSGNCREVPLMRGYGLIDVPEELRNKAGYAALLLVRPSSKLAEILASATPLRKKFEICREYWDRPIRELHERIAQAAKERSERAEAEHKGLLALYEEKWSTLSTLERTRILKEIKQNGGHPNSRRLRAEYLHDHLYPTYIGG